MRSFRRVSIGLILACLAGLASWRTAATQDTIETPAQKTKEAIQKFSRTPAAISKGLEALKDAAKAKLQQAVGGKAAPDANAPSGKDSLPEKKTDAAAAARTLPENRRDPFRPMTMRTRTVSRPRENLSPLERFELGQLKVVGIVWDTKEPRAMIEDAAGLGYIVKIGTPIGSNEGKVKVIHRNEVVVEEFYSDFHGARKTRHVSMKFSAE